MRTCERSGSNKYGVQNFLTLRDKKMYRCLHLVPALSAKNCFTVPRIPFNAMYDGNRFMNYTLYFAETSNAKELSSMSAEYPP